VRVFAKVIKRWLRDVGGGEPLLIFYWWGLPELTEAVANAASVYDCVDDHAALPGSYAGRERVERLEGLTVDAVDWTYVVSPALLQARARAGRHIAVLPTAVDFRLFGDLERAGFAIPAVLRSAPRPVVGYSGALGNRMDWELLEELTRRRPQWSFVFVGGDPRSVPDTVRRPNVFFTGTMPFRTALAAMSSFDAAIIPVVENRFTAGNSFLKLREYFAHGTPVVAPPLPDPASVAEQAPGLLALARDPDEWMDALTVALEEPSTSPLRAARRAYVEERSIERRTARIVCDALGDDSSSHDTAVSEYIGA
jgi:glycosyltransferase involved in cell wall biosynthesis